MRQRGAFLLLAVGSVLSCTDTTGPGETLSGAPRRDLVDGRNGGAPDFYFLSPLAPAITYASPFDGTRSPIVEICPLSQAGQCGAVVARFAMTAGKGQDHTWIEVKGQHYVVNWKTKQSDLSLNQTYRIRVLEGSSELGHVDTRMVKKDKDSRSLPAGVVGVVLGSTLPIKFRLSASGGGTAVRLEIHPGTFLLTGAGQEQSLEVSAFDAQGRPAGGQVVWHSSNEAVMTVSADGVAHAVAGSGSAQVTAQIGTATSVPALGLITQPPEGALLISDDDVVGEIVPVDPNAPYVPGWQFRVRLTGVNPTVGQILLTTGELPVGGRVVSVTPVGNDIDVVLALLSIADMFPTLSIDETISLDQSELALSTSLTTNYSMERQPSGTLELAPRNSVSFGAGGLRNTVIRPVGPMFANIEFELGPFKCEVKNVVGAAVLNSIGAPSVQINPSLSLDLNFNSGNLQKLVVNGGLQGTISFNSSFPAAIEEKVECKAKLGTITLPIGGPLALLIGGQIPVGVGFELGGKLTLGNIGVDASMTAGVTMSLGIDCTVSCGPVADLTGTATGSIKPILPTSWTDVKNELSGTAFAYAELAIGNAFIQSLQFKTVEAKGGLKQELKLASKATQASDATYASSFGLSFDVEAGSGSSLSAVAGLLGINLAELKVARSFPLAQSPVGTLQITPATVTPGSSTQLGQQATFTVQLNPVNYLGVYAVEGIEIRWLKNGVLEPGRPGCTDLTAAQDQTTFTCSTDFLDTQLGDQTFYAFVKARIFGIPIPVPLEIALDSHATVRVATGGAVTAGGSGSVFTAAGGNEPGNTSCRKSLASSGTASSLSQTDNCTSTFVYTFTISGVTTTITYTGNAAQSYSYDATGTPTTLRVQMSGSSSASVSESQSGGGLTPTGRSPQSRSICFAVPSTVSYSLTGTVSGAAKTTGFTDAGRAEVVLFKTGVNTVVYVADAGYNNFFAEDFPTSVPVSGSGTLTAGTYCLLAEINVKLESATGTRSTAGAVNVVLQLTP